MVICFPIGIYMVGIWSAYSAVMYATYKGQPSAEILLVEEERTPALADYIRKNGGAKWLCQESMAS